ncbi:MAG: tyrosine-type recombinase/integrase [Elusimicrobia bacterium]|nr:tyrosine-type recombinase/integrase [Elusimicrobiota bacterium]
MARIYQVAGKKGATWYLDYAVDGRRVRKRVGRSKKLAELALADTQVKLERRELGFTQTDKKLDDLIAEYLKHVRANGIAYSHDLSVAVLERFKGHLGLERLKDIGHLKIENYKNWRRESGILASSVNRELAIIKAMFNRGVEWGFLPRSPAQAVKMFKEPKRQARFFSPDEIKKMLAADDLVMRLIVSVLVNTGLRRDELLHLTWGDVNLERKQLTVQAKDGWRPKDYEVRHIPLNAAALKTLNGLRGGRDPKDWVFRDAAGQRYRADFLTHRFKKFLRGLKIEGSLHSLRHTFASHLIMKGADLYSVSKLLGHASIKTTEIYAHLAADHLTAAVSRLEF